MQDPKLTPVNFSRLLANLIAERGITQKRLAADIGVSEASIVKWLKGSMPLGGTLTKLAGYFGIHPDYLINPERYAAPMQKARDAAEAFKGSAKEKQLEFDRVVRLEMSKLSERQAGFEAMESLMDKVDWRKRALAAESKLADLKKTLAGLAEKL